MKLEQVNTYLRGFQVWTVSNYASDTVKAIDCFELDLEIAEELRDRWLGPGS